MSEESKISEYLQAFKKSIAREDIEVAYDTILKIAENTKEIPNQIEAIKRDIGSILSSSVKFLIDHRDHRRTSSTSLHVAEIFSNCSYLQTGRSHIAASKAISSLLDLLKYFLETDFLAQRAFGLQHCVETIAYLASEVDNPSIANDLLEGLIESMRITQSLSIKLAAKAHGILAFFCHPANVVLSQEQFLDLCLKQAPDHSDFDTLNIVLSEHSLKHLPVEALHHIAGTCIRYFFGKSDLSKATVCCEILYKLHQEQPASQFLKQTDMSEELVVNLSLSYLKVPGVAPEAMGKFLTILLECLQLSNLEKLKESIFIMMLQTPMDMSFANVIFSLAYKLQVFSTAMASMRNFSSRYQNGSSSVYQYRELFEEKKIEVLLGVCIPETSDFDLIISDYCTDVSKYAAILNLETKTISKDAKSDITREYNDIEMLRELAAIFRYLCFAKIADDDSISGARCLVPGPASLIMNIILRIEERHVQTKPVLDFLLNAFWLFSGIATNKKAYGDCLKVFNSQSQKISIFEQTRNIISWLKPVAGAARLDKDVEHAALYFLQATVQNPDVAKLIITKVLGPKSFLEGLSRNEDHPAVQVSVIQLIDKINLFLEGSIFNSKDEFKSMYRTAKYPKSLASMIRTDQKLYEKEQHLSEDVKIYLVEQGLSHWRNLLARNNFEDEEKDICDVASATNLFIGAWSKDIIKSEKFTDQTIRLLIDIMSTHSRDKQLVSECRLRIEKFKENEEHKIPVWKFHSEILTSVVACVGPSLIKTDASEVKQGLLLSKNVLEQTAKKKKPISTPPTYWAFHENLYKKAETEVKENSQQRNSSEKPEEKRKSNNADQCVIVMKILKIIQRLIDKYGKKEEDDDMGGLTLVFVLEKWQEQKSADNSMIIENNATISQYVSFVMNRTKSLVDDLVSDSSNLKKNDAEEFNAGLECIQLIIGERENLETLLVDGINSLLLKALKIENLKLKKKSVEVASISTGFHFEIAEFLTHEAETVNQCLVDVLFSHEKEKNEYSLEDLKLRSLNTTFPIKLTKNVSQNRHVFNNTMAFTNMVQIYWLCESQDEQDSHFSQTVVLPELFSAMRKVVNESYIPYSEEIRFPETLINKLNYNFVNEKHATTPDLVFILSYLTKSQLLRLKYGSLLDENSQNVILILVKYICWSQNLLNQMSENTTSDKEMNKKLEFLIKIYVNCSLCCAHFCIDTPSNTSRFFEYSDPIIAENGKSGKSNKKKETNLPPDLCNSCMDTSLRFKAPIRWEIFNGTAKLISNITCRHYMAKSRMAKRQMWEKLFKIIDLSSENSSDISSDGSSRKPSGSKGSFSHNECEALVSAFSSIGNISWFVGSADKMIENGIYQDFNRFLNRSWKAPFYVLASYFSALEVIFSTKTPDKITTQKNSFNDIATPILHILGRRNVSIECLMPMLDCLYFLCKDKTFAKEKFGLEGVKRTLKCLWRHTKEPKVYEPGIKLIGQLINQSNQLTGNLVKEGVFNFLYKSLRVVDYNDPYFENVHPDVLANILSLSYRCLRKISIKSEIARQTLVGQKIPDGSIETNESPTSLTQETVNGLSQIERSMRLFSVRTGDKSCYKVSADTELEGLLCICTILSYFSGPVVEGHSYSMPVIEENKENKVPCLPKKDVSNKFLPNEFPPDAETGVRMSSTLITGIIVSFCRSTLQKKNYKKSNNTKLITGLLAFFCNPKPPGVSDAIAYIFSKEDNINAPKGAEVIDRNIPDSNLFSTLLAWITNYYSDYDSKIGILNSIAEALNGIGPLFYEYPALKDVLTNLERAAVDRSEMSKSETHYVIKTVNSIGAKYSNPPLEEDESNRLRRRRFDLKQVLVQEPYPEGFASLETSTFDWLVRGTLAGMAKRTDKKYSSVGNVEYEVEIVSSKGEMIPSFFSVSLCYRKIVFITLLDKDFKVFPLSRLYGVDCRYFSVKEKEIWSILRQNDFTVVETQLCTLVFKATHDSKEEKVHLFFKTLGHKPHLKGSNRMALFVKHVNRWHQANNWAF